MRANCSIAEVDIAVNVVWRPDEILIVTDGLSTGGNHATERRRWGCEDRYSSAFAAGVRCTGIARHPPCHNRQIRKRHPRRFCRLRGVAAGFCPPDRGRDGTASAERCQKRIAHRRLLATLRTIPWRRAMITRARPRTLCSPPGRGSDDGGNRRYAFRVPTARKFDAARSEVSCS
jgi:hypothetical protein